jgi:hypothetical protein
MNPRINDEARLFRNRQENQESPLYTNEYSMKPIGFIDFRIMLILWSTYTFTQPKLTTTELAVYTTIPNAFADNPRSNNYLAK